MDEAVQRKAKDLTVSSKIINYCNKNGKIGIRLSLAGEERGGEGRGSKMSFTKL